MKETQAIKRVNAASESGATAEISRVAVTAIGLSAGVIGIWAVACMAAGLLNSGGPVTLVSSLFKAITG